jgi:hypothetical protein
MVYRPDIMITAPETGDVLAVVEVTGRHPAGSDRRVAQLFECLRSTGGGIALLITPESVTIFRDRSLSSDPRSMERTGPLPLGRLFYMLGSGQDHGLGSDQDHGVGESAMANLVGRWMEDLAAGRLDRVIPQETREALERQVVPLLRASQVSFAPPRRLDYA